MCAFLTQNHPFFYCGVHWKMKSIIIILFGFKTEGKPGFMREVNLSCQNLEFDG